MQLGWIDFSPTHRKRLESIMDLFQEKRVLDELGIGTVRDAFANTLFPGTTTIQTRARYFLIVPWCMQEVERDKRKIKDYRKNLHELEYRLIDTLCQGEDQQGVIGKNSRRTLKRKPSSIYWNGMKTYGIIQWQGSMEAYMQNIRKGDLLTSGPNERYDEQEDEEEKTVLWASVPPPPDDWQNKLSLRLTKEEAGFLRRQVIHHGRDSLWAKILEEEKYEVLDYPSIEPLEEDESLPEGLRRLVHQAVQFNQLMKGALIFYNLKVRELVEQDPGPLQGAWEKYLSEIASFRWEDWKTTRLWDRFPYIDLNTRRFIEKWISFLKEENFGDPATELLRKRELKLKGIHRARLADKSAAQKLPEDSYPGIRLGPNGTVYYLDYRWGIVTQLLADIKDGLNA